MDPYKTMYLGPVCNTFSDAIDTVLCKALDYLPDVSNV